jgi:hypothetical protein
MSARLLILMTGWMVGGAWSTRFDEVDLARDVINSAVGMEGGRS